MKSFITTYCKLPLRIMILMAIALVGLCGCTGNDKKTVTSLETMTLTVRGMRGGYVYTIADDEGKTELSLYREVYASGEAVLEIEKSVACDAQAMVELMNACDVMHWDGFHGKHPKTVKDGIMFRFTASVNGGQTIQADGSANFPKGYREFVRELDHMLAECDNNSGM